MLTFDYDRANEMLELRYGKKWTLDKIGIKYGVSRERVRQIIGNSGHMAESGVNPERARITQDESETREYAGAHPEMDNNQVVEKLGIPYRIVTKVRAGTRHAISGGRGKDGAEVEQMVSDLLCENGVPNKLMPNHDMHDIELMDGRRVEVKARLHTTQRTKTGKAHYHFTLIKPCHGTAQQRAEFYVLVLPNHDVFVIPSSEIPDGRVAIDFCVPEAKNGKGRKNPYWQYKNRFDLLKG